MNYTAHQLCVYSFLWMKAYVRLIIFVMGMCDLSVFVFMSVQILFHSVVQLWSHSGEVVYSV